MSNQEHRPSVVDADVVSASTQFAFDLLKEMTQERPDANLFFSPYSISMALAMLYNGPSGETQRVITQTLHLFRLGLSEVNDSYSRLTPRVVERDPELILNIANSVWGQDQAPLDPAFLDRVRRHSQADVKSLAVDDHPNELINTWVLEATNGKIGNLLDGPAGAGMYLVNAV